MFGLNFVFFESLIFESERGEVGEGSVKLEFGRYAINILLR